MVTKYQNEQLHISTGEVRSPCGCFEMLGLNCHLRVDMHWLLTSLVKKMHNKAVDELSGKQYSLQILNDGNAKRTFFSNDQQSIFHSQL